MLYFFAPFFETALLENQKNTEKKRAFFKKYILIFLSLFIYYNTFSVQVSLG